MEENKTIRIECEGSFICKLDDLKDLQGNLKNLTTDNYQKLSNSLIEFGFSFPVFVWEDKDSTKYIVDAHQRIRTLRQMRSEGWFVPELPCVRVFAKDRVEAKKKLLVLNSRYGEITETGFADFINEEGFEIDVEEIDDYLTFPEIDFSSEEPQVTEDEAPEVSSDPAKSELGKVYQLGRHRVMCGDATKGEDVEKLMNSEKMDMVFTDPPYGISIVGESGGVGGGTEGKYRPVLGDDSIDAAVDAYTLLMAYEIKKMIWWGGNYYASHLTDSPCWIVWDKQDGKQVTFADCELAWTNFKSPTRMYTHIWDGFRRDSEQGETRVHPTQKPVALLARIMKDYGNENDKVIDVFGGSGSTLMACEQTNKTCYMLELDPKYVDVIRKRYAKFIDKADEWEGATPEIQ